MECRRLVAIRKAGVEGACGLFVLLLALFSATSSWSDEKVGVVDFESLLTTLRGMEGGRVEGGAGRLPEEIDPLERELKALKERFGRERARLTSEARERYEQQILERADAIQRLQGEVMRENLFKIRLRPREAVGADLERLIQRFGREQGFALILDSKGRRVLYRAEGSAEMTKGQEIDIQQDLLKLFPEELSSGRIGAGPGK